MTKVPESRAVRTTMAPVLMSVSVSGDGRRIYKSRLKKNPGFSVLTLKLPLDGPALVVTLRGFAARVVALVA